MSNNPGYAEWSAWTAPLIELQQINQDAAEKVVRECISFYSDNAATAVKSSQLMQRVTTPEDFVTTQMKLLTQQGEKTLEFMQNVFQIYQTVLKNHSKWTEEKVSSAVKTAGKSVKKQEE